MMHKTRLLALLNELELLSGSLSVSTNDCKYPKVWGQLEKEFEDIIAFIALGGRMGRSTRELHNHFVGMMDASKIRERLNWLIVEKKIMKSVGAKYTNFYFLK